MADEKLRIVLNLDGSGQVSAALRGVRSDLTHTQASIITLNQGLDLLGKGWSLASRGIELGARFLGDAIKASNEQEDALKALNQTLVSSGQYSDRYSQQLQDLASSLQNVTAFGDETILGVERLLISFGAAPNQIEQMTRAVLDLSTGLGTDLQSAALLVGKAIAGETGTLSRYGIIVDENASKTQKLDQALAQIERRFGGQASAAAETFSGSLARINNQWGDFLEKVGDAIKRSDFVADALEAVNAELIGLNHNAASAADPASKLANEIFKTMALRAADAAIAVGNLVAFIVRLGETVTVVPNAVLGSLFGDFDFDTQVTDWRALSNEILKGVGVVQDLRARVESFGTDAPRQLGAVAAAGQDMGERAGGGFEKLSTKEKEAKKALDDYREATKLAASGNALLGNTFDPVRTRLDAIQKLLTAVGKGVVPETSVNVKALRDEFFSLSEELEGRSLPRFEDLIAELRGPGKEAFADVTKEVQELEQTAGQINLSPLEKQIDDFNHRIDEAKKKAPQLADELEKMRDRGVAAIEATAETLEDRFGDALHGAVEGIVRGTRDAGDILDLFKDAAIGTFVDLFTETIKRKTSLLDIPLQGNLLEDIPNIFSRAASLILGGDFGSLFGDLFGLKTAGESRGLVPALLGGGAGGGALGSAGVSALGLGTGGGLGVLTLLRFLASGGSFAGPGTALTAQEAALLFPRGQVPASWLGGTGGQAGGAAAGGSTLWSSYTFWGAVAAISKIVGDELQKSGSPQIRGIGRTASAAGQPVPQLYARDLAGVRDIFTEFNKTMIVGGPAVNAILQGLGIDIGDWFGMGGPSRGQLSRRFLGTDILKPLTSITAGLEKFDPSKFFAPFEKFPQLAAEAGAAASAFGTTLAVSIDSGVKNSDELNYVFNTLIDNLGEAGVSGPDAVARIAGSMRELGITTDEAGAALTQAFQSGKITLDQYNVAMQGLGQIAAVTTDEIVSTLRAGLNDEAKAVFDRMVAAGADSFNAVVVAGNSAFAGIAATLSNDLLPHAVEVFTLMKINGITAADEVRRAWENLAGLGAQTPNTQAGWYQHDGKLMYGHFAGGQFVPDAAPLLSPDEQKAARKTAPKFGSGGVVPGLPGEPIWVMAHGRETVLPTHSEDGLRRFARAIAREAGGVGGSRAPIIVNLTLDGRRIAQAVVDAGGSRRGAPL